MVVLCDSEDDEALRSTFRQVFLKHHNEAPIPADSALDRPLLWKQLSELGALEMAAPEADGGGGATLWQLCVLAQEAGHNAGSAGLVEHLAATHFLGTIAVSTFGDTVPKGHTVTLALAPSREGRWRNVLVSSGPSVVIGVHDGDVVAVQLDSPPRACQSGPLRFAAIELVQAEPSWLAGAVDFDHALDIWRILTAAFLVGVSESVVARTVEYVASRRQFGRVVGAYQAMQHGLAELPGMIEGTRLLAGKAAWSLTERADPAEIDLARNDITDGKALAAMALLFGAETATAAVDRAVHYHGAIGAAAETGLHDFYHMARSLPVLLGPLSVQRRHLADLLLEPTWNSP